MRPSPRKATRLKPMGRRLLAMRPQVMKRLARRRMVAPITAQP